MKGENQIESRCDCLFEFKVAKHLLCRNSDKNQRNGSNFSDEGQVHVPTAMVTFATPIKPLIAHWITFPRSECEIPGLKDSHVLRSKHGMWVVVTPPWWGIPCNGWICVCVCGDILCVYIYIDIYNSIILYISACWGLGSVAVIPQFLTLVSISIHESMTMPRYQLDAVWDTPNFHLRRACSPDFLSSQRYTVPYAPRPSLTGWIKAEKFSTMENRSLDISV